MYTDIVSIKTEKTLLFYLPLYDYKDKKWDVMITGQIENRKWSYWVYVYI